jgi:hypothetical protein
MPDTAQIMRPTTVPAPDFGTTTTFVETGVVSASFWAISGGEAIILERLDVRADVTVALPHDADVRETDEIVLTEGEGGQVHHLRVVYVHDRSLPLTVHVSCEEIKYQQ